MRVKQGLVLARKRRAINFYQTVPFMSLYLSQPILIAFKSPGEAFANYAYLRTSRLIWYYQMSF